MESTDTNSFQAAFTNSGRKALGSRIERETIDPIEVRRAGLKRLALRAAIGTTAFVAGTAATAAGLNYAIDRSPTVVYQQKLEEHRQKIDSGAIPGTYGTDMAPPAANAPEPTPEAAK